VTRLAARRKLKQLQSSKFGLFATGFFHLLVQHYAIYVHIHLFNQVGSSKNCLPNGKAFALI